MRHAHGSSLVESLVALAVFAIGGASTATWITQSMATDARASRLVAATTLAVSLETRMRANRDAAIAGDYESPPTQIRKYGSNRDASLHDAPTRRDCFDGCDRHAMAREDLRVFRTELLRWLGPAADASVTCAPPAACVIAITWAGRDVLTWPFQP